MSTRERTPDLDELALAALHQRLGARFVDEGGVAVPGDYGDPAGELASMRADHAVVDLSWLGRLELRGRDRHRFLNGLVTANIKDLAGGRSVYGLVLTKQGRVLADVHVTALEDRLWLELPAGASDRIRRHLESYRVIDDVEVAPLDDMVLIGALGPGAAKALGDAVAALEPDATTRARVDGTEVQIVRRRVFGIEGFVLWAPASLAEDIFTGLAARRASGSGASRTSSRVAGLEALDAMRIEAGRGRFGIDFGEETVANETGLVEDAIDFTKGCYLGQEIVARIHYRGKPSALCVPVEVTGRAAPPPVPSRIRAAGGDGNEDSGTLTSVAPGASPGAWLGIASLQRRALEAEAPMALEAGGEVRLRLRPPQ
ncbi:MAG TPA: hypothetical protein VMS86_12410 [Thermoanaerobaculia bacterium]|nr:hypothetical protein [Thermoanaerobaculia bacterium]